VGVATILQYDADRLIAESGMSEEEFDFLRQTAESMGQTMVELVLGLMEKNPQKFNMRNNGLRETVGDLQATLRAQEGMNRALYEALLRKGSERTPAETYELGELAILLDIA
jgi:hypothetical protein